MGHSSQTEEVYLQQGKCNQDLNELIDKEGRLALNLSDCQKCPAVYILHETSRKKTFIKLSSRSKNNAKSFSLFCANSVVRVKTKRRAKEEALWIGKFKTTRVNQKSNTT